MVNLIGQKNFPSLKIRSKLWGSLLTLYGLFERSATLSPLATFDQNSGHVQKFLRFGTIIKTITCYTSRHFLPYFGRQLTRPRMKRNFQC